MPRKNLALIEVQPVVEPEVTEENASVNGKPLTQEAFEALVADRFVSVREVVSRAEYKCPVDIAAYNSIRAAILRERGVESDGGREDCHVCGQSFQPVCRGNRGNFRAIKLGTGSGKFAVVAVCYHCKKNSVELQTLVTYPRSATEQFAREQNRRMAAIKQLLSESGR